MQKLQLEKESVTNKSLETELEIKKLGHIVMIVKIKFQNFYENMTGSNKMKNILMKKVEFMILK